MFKRLFAIGAIAVAGMASVPVQAATYSFACLSNSNAGHCADGEAGLVMDVTDAGNGRVDFTFRNYSAQGGIVSEVYFDDGTLLGIAALLDSGAGVDFTDQGVNPGNLPAHNNATPAFATTAGFAVDVVKNANKDGIGNTLDGGVQEFLTIRFDLINGHTFANTLQALDGQLTGSQGEPALRVGLHVVAFANGGSESFMNLAAPVPEADTYALMLVGLGLVGRVVRRQSRRQQDFQLIARTRA